MTDSVIGAITLPADVTLAPGESTAALTGKWTYTDDGTYPNTVTAKAVDGGTRPRDREPRSPSRTCGHLGTSPPAHPADRRDRRDRGSSRSRDRSVIGHHLPPTSRSPRESTRPDRQVDYTDDGTYPSQPDDDGNEATATASAEVTVTDTLPDITITKDASPAVVPETGGNVEFTIVVTNNSPEPATITALTDTDFDLAIWCPSAVGTVLTHGQTYTCIFTVLVSGDFESGISHEDTATAVAADDDGNSDTASDGATVRFTDVDPLIDVEKYVWDGAAWQDADVPTGPHLAADPLFKFVVTNTGPVALSQLTLTDLPAIAQFFANEALTAPCLIPASLAPAASSPAMARCRGTTGCRPTQPRPPAAWPTAGLRDRNRQRRGQLLRRPTELHGHESVSARSLSPRKALRTSS